MLSGARSLLSLNWVMRDRSPYGVTVARIHASSECSGTCDCTKTIERAGCSVEEGPPPRAPVQPPPESRVEVAPPSEVPAYQQPPEPYQQPQVEVSGSVELPVSEPPPVSVEYLPPPLLEEYAGSPPF